MCLIFVVFGDYKNVLATNIFQIMVHIKNLNVYNAVIVVSGDKSTLNTYRKALMFRGLYISQIND